MLVLSMDIQKACSSGLHLTYSTCLSINLVDASSIHDFSGQKYLSIFRTDIQCFQCLQCFLVFYLKKQLHKCIGCIFPYHIFRSFCTQDQLYRLQKDRFTCSGLTGQDIQSGTKFYFYFFYQCKIFHMQMS